MRVLANEVRESYEWQSAIEADADWWTAGRRALCETGTPTVFVRPVVHNQVDDDFRLTARMVVTIGVVQGDQSLTLAERGSEVVAVSRSLESHARAVAELRYGKDANVVIEYADY